LLATAQSPAMLFYLDNFQSISPNAQLASGGRRGQGNGALGALLGLGRGGRRSVDGRMERDPNMRQPGDGNPPQAPPGGARARRGINENYARELMELHTLGVDGGYTQKDVQEVARCFTGWTIFQPRGGAGAAYGVRVEEARRTPGTFFFNPRTHDDGEKLVLGHKIAAGGGIDDGIKVLDILAHHPSTAKFI